MSWLAIHNAFVLSAAFWGGLYALFLPGPTTAERVLLLLGITLLALALLRDEEP